MKHWRILSASTVVLAMSAVSSAITFSNISVTDNVGNVLVNGFSVNPGTNDIDFLFPNAFVGDLPASLRSGTITITFEANSGPSLAMNSVNLSVLGATAGSGIVGVSEQVDDLVNPGVIGSYSTNSNSTPLPISQFITFTRNSTHVKVTKTIRLDAEDTGVLDLAQVSLVQQKFNTTPVPEPASLAALGVGAFALIRRRRKKA